MRIELRFYRSINEYSEVWHPVRGERRNYFQCRLTIHPEGEAPSHEEDCRELQPNEHQARKWGENRVKAWQERNPGAEGIAYVILVPAPPEGTSRQRRRKKALGIS